MYRNTRNRHTLLRQTYQLEITIKNILSIQAKYDINALMDENSTVKSKETIPKKMISFQSNTAHFTIYRFCPEN